MDKIKLKLFLILSVLILSGCTTGAKQGDTVLVDYTGTLEDGTVFDSSEGKQPLSVALGQGQVIPGFEEALLGMAVGEEKDITLPPSEAYGESDPSLIDSIPKENLQGDVDLTPGEILYAVDSVGNQRQATIVSSDDETITLDLNHPLAGKTLNFKVKVVKIN